MSYKFGNELPIKVTNQSKNAGVYTRTLFGQNIHENPVPVWTADKAQRPFVVFQDPKRENISGLTKICFLVDLLQSLNPVVVKPTC